MGYITDLEQELTTLLHHGDEQALIKLVKEKVLESYKNGILSAKLVKADKDASRKVKSFARRT